MDNENLTFSIDSLTPDTLSMSRLAEYLKELSVLYGSIDHVHFDRVSEGSACLNVRIEEHAINDVHSRLSLVNLGDAPADITKAYNAVDRLLRADNATGAIYARKGSNVLIFPGRTRPDIPSISIDQQTTVDGVVIKIGGRDDTIPVRLRDIEGNIIRCMVKGQSQAKEIAKYYLDVPLRVNGIGSWTRDANGWRLENLTIQSWEPLDTRPAHEVLEHLSMVDNNSWNQLDDPIYEWKKLRGFE